MSPPNTNPNTNHLTRREFVAATSLALAGNSLFASGADKRRVAIVGVGVRGSRFWLQHLQQNYGDVIEYVGICDSNPGRVDHARELVDNICPGFTDFDRMMDQTRPDLLIVTTVDSTHDEFIVKALQRDIDVITEKPMVTDEAKCQAVLDAAYASKGQLINALNYRWHPTFSRIQEVLQQGQLGRVTSVDFHWYLNVHHGASYFRRWHGYRRYGGTLLVHKAAHHFDLLNWWIGSDPVEVVAYGALEKYGANNPFRGERCMTCPLAGKCDFHWDMTQRQSYMDLYYANEKYDGYIRDNCLWRESIDIFDKMAVQVRYANNVQVSYSLTTYSPYEGYRVAFNGMNGRLDAASGIPSMAVEQTDQAELHAREMSHSKNLEHDELVTQLNFQDWQREHVSYSRGGHGGGDYKMFDYLFRGQDARSQLQRPAGLRDGALSVLLGIAARRSIDEGRPVRIDELTTLEPSVERLHGGA